MPNLTPIPYPTIANQPIPGLAENAALVENFQKSEREQFYKIYVVCQEQEILVSAWLPEQLGMDVSATYDSPFAQGLSGIGPAAIGNVARYLGLALTTQAFTIQVWQGGTY